MKRSDYIWVTLFTTLIWVLKILTMTKWVFMYDFVLPITVGVFYFDAMIGFIASVDYFDEKKRFGNTQKIYTFSSVGVVLFGILHSIKEAVS